MNEFVALCAYAVFNDRISYLLPFLAVCVGAGCNLYVGAGELVCKRDWDLDWDLGPNCMYEDFYISFGGYQQVATETYSVYLLCEHIQYMFQGTH